MSQAYSLKEANKPTLFSWDLETEHKNIEKRVLDNRNYSRRDLEKELSTLKELATDYLQIIQTKAISPEQLASLEEAVVNGASGVWEQAATKLERLSYHFNEAKKKIYDLIERGNPKTVDRALTMLGAAFTEDEQVEVLEKVLSSKSSKVRNRAAAVAYFLRNKHLVPVLLERKNVETNTEVSEAINLALEQINQC
ncbi:hypothetical protein [Pontibacter ruber]|uniref:HEAT repeat domain-containing protein n=1 Tax=Pontibacter ruber TaxID=1343895 RepID=A0ABW5CVE6_9BACT|nr:hypothetical protein [Pontibacter ruber]